MPTIMHEIETFYSNFGKEMYTPLCSVIIYAGVRGIQKLMAAKRVKPGAEPVLVAAPTPIPNWPARLNSLMAYQLNRTRQESLAVLKRAKTVSKKQAETEMTATLNRFTHLGEEAEIQAILVLDAQQEQQDRRAYTERTGLL